MMAFSTSSRSATHEKFFAYSHSIADHAGLQHEPVTGAVPKSEQLVIVEYDANAVHGSQLLGRCASEEPFDCDEQSAV